MTAALGVPVLAPAAFTVFAGGATLCGVGGLIFNFKELKHLYFRRLRLQSQRQPLKTPNSRRAFNKTPNPS
jgi:hypothetical protein